MLNCMVNYIYLLLILLVFVVIGIKYLSLWWNYYMFVFKKEILIGVS